MDSQRTKIRKIDESPDEFTGMTDLEWAEIKVAFAKWNKARRDTGYNTQACEVEFLEYQAKVEEVLAFSATARRFGVKNDPEPNLMVFEDQNGAVWFTLDRDKVKNVDQGLKFRGFLFAKDKITIESIRDKEVRTICVTETREVSA